MKKKLVIFDLDGTILDTIMDLTNALNFALQKHNRDILSLDEVKHKTGKGMKILLKETMGDKDIEDFNQAYFEFSEFYSVFSCLFTKPYPNVFETLTDLKNKGYKLAVISNKLNNITNIIINKYYPNIFDFVTGEIEGVAKKPDKALVEICLKTLNVNKEDVLYVGDSNIDYETAKNSNLDYMIVTYGFRSKEELESLGIDNLEDSITSIYKYI